MHLDSADGFLMVGKRRHRLPRNEVPQLDLTIVRPGDDLPTKEHGGGVEAEREIATFIFFNTKW